MENILFEKRDQIGIVTFNRPNALNALNEETLYELKTLIAELEQDSEITVVVFTGAGKAFIAGADIKAMASLNAEEGRQFGRLGQSVFRAVEKMEKVTIAAVNGFALGGGLEFALSCDLRYAHEKAKFGQPEVSLGITPGFAGTQRLPRVVGIAKAKEIIYTGRMIDAEHAEKIGLINGITADNVLEVALETAELIASQAPIAVKYAKKAIDVGANVSIEEGNEVEATLFGLCFATLDQKDGMKAFLNKGKAAFQNK
ncbi:enoyl-CoA hydratase-related protein [Fusibacter sp. 3D3]|uniref:enoyl-CoA hydratase-related protein n=1 Tax=Fusibacter sp. 3D3 TaxID=1048380 RepID=UPI0008531A8B|nr:enoyl-CoA hydratase-related protein [Fusibacter sp. 3D3]GAU76131.1 3-hydroxybutyryl-CoA dehydratase [Fusibacter sp. 3D3]